MLCSTNDRTRPMIYHEWQVPCQITGIAWGLLLLQLYIIFKFLLKSNIAILGHIMVFQNKFISEDCYLELPLVSTGMFCSANYRNIRAGSHAAWWLMLENRVPAITYTSSFVKFSLYYVLPIGPVYIENNIRNICYEMTEHKIDQKWHLFTWALTNQEYSCSIPVPY